MTVKHIKIQTGFIRLDQFLKFSGVAETGGHAKQLVKEGLVQYNGEPCTQRGKKLYPGDEIIVEDHRLLVD